MDSKNVLPESGRARSKTIKPSSRETSPIPGQIPGPIPDSSVFEKLKSRGKSPLPGLSPIMSAPASAMSMSAPATSISTNPFDYLELHEVKDEENKHAERAFFNFYEEPKIQQNIYKIIKEDIRNPNMDNILNSRNENSFFTACNEKQFIERPFFYLKSANDILCTESSNNINGYIEQIKKDWGRLSSRTIYASKYNSFFSVINQQPYFNSANDDNNKEFLTVVNALYDFLINDDMDEKDDEFLVVGDLNKDSFNDALKIKDIEFTDKTGKTSCGCDILYRKGGAKYTSNCKSMNSFKNLNPITLNILYKLLVIFQSSSLEIVNALNEYLNNVKCKYDIIAERTGCKPIGFMYFDSYYYFDDTNKSLISMFKIYLQIDGDTNGKSGFIPFYKVMHVYPLKKYDSSYYFVYIDKDPPFNYEESTANILKFMENRIAKYLELETDDFNGFFYTGKVLTDYQKQMAQLHRKKNRQKLVIKVGGKKMYRKRKINRTKKSKKSSKTKKTRKNKRKSRKY